MNRNEKFFKVGLIFFSLLVFLVSTGGALGVVWLKQQISRTAESCIVKEKELIALHRKNGSLQSTIAQMHNPDYLKERIGRKMSMPSKKQIVWMGNKDLKEQKYIAAVKNQAQTMAVVMGGSGSQRVIR